MSSSVPASVSLKQPEVRQDSMHGWNNGVWWRWVDEVRGRGGLGGISVYCRQADLLTGADDCKF